MDMILPPFETAIALGGARSVMNSYADVDGVPAGADPWLLTEVLRGDWGFTGTVVSDYWAIPFLATMHRVADGPQDAGVQALSAGIDVELPDTLGFGRHLADRVRRGELPESLVDRAAGRLLAQKIALGLLDPDWTPEGSVAGASTVDLDGSANRALARELAERSIVLLDAGTALPLRPGLERVAVVGPCADDPRTFMGCYAFPNHVLPRHPGLGLGVEAPSVLDALRAELPGARVEHARGCEVSSDDRSGFAAAEAAARDAELCVAVVGDLAGLFGHGTSGEGCDAEDLRLPGVQGDLLAALAATGTPMVVVVISGRPYALGAVHATAAALVQAFMPGEEGGAAIAGVLSGRIQPGGKLPVQIPRTVGGQPGTYLQPPLGADSNGISNLDPTPLFPFGHGASYTTFAVDDLRISEAAVPTDGEFTVSVRVCNTGERAGDEVVQLYLHDLLAQVTRPVRQLAGFARVALAPGEASDVQFQVHTDRTAFTGRDLRRIVEPGELEVLVGTSAADLPCRGTVTLTGPVRTVGHDRRLETPVKVYPLRGDRDAHA
jgi:beta-glucosidase